MVCQGYGKIRRSKQLLCCIKTPATYEEFLMVMIVNAKKCTVQGQYCNTTVVDRDYFYRTACGIGGKKPDGFEIVVVPFRECVELLCQMWSRRVRVKVFISIFLGIKGSEKKFT